MRRRDFALPAFLLLTVCQMGRADDGTAEAEVRFDIQTFGRLPILLNGRVTNFDHYARNAMLRISDRETWQDKDGKSQPAVAWLLELMSGSEVAESVPLIFVEHPHVRKLLELDPGTDERRVSIKELFTKMAPFEERVDEIQKSLTRRTDDERVVLEFSFRLDFLGRVLGVFRRPDLSQEATLIASLRQAMELEKQAIPFVVAPQKPGGPWLTSTYALIQAHVVKKEEVNPASLLYARLIESYRNRDSAAFNQVVQDLTLLIKDQKLSVCPLEFTSPRGWIEEGTPRLVKQHFFGDAEAFGTTVTTLNLFEGTEHLMMHINFFPQGAASRERIVNHWRVDTGRTPQALEAVKTTPVMVGGQTGWQVDIESPDDLPIRSERVLGAGFSHGKQTWVVAGTGPKRLMAKHAKEIEQFVASIKIADPEAMEKWFSLPKPIPLPDVAAGTKAVLTIVPDRQDVWVIQGSYLAEEAPDEKIETMTSIIKSIQFRPRGKGTAAADVLPFTWTLPEDWQVEEFPDGELVVVARTRPAFVAVTIQPLKANGELSLPNLINQWRAKRRLPELPAEKIDTTKTLTVDNRQITFIVAETP